MPTSAGKQLKGGSSGVSTTKGVRRTHRRPLLPSSMHRKETVGCSEIMKMIKVLYGPSVKASSDFYAQETLQFVLRNGWRLKKHLNKI